MVEEEQLVTELKNPIISSVVSTSTNNESIISSESSSNSVAELNNVETNSLPAHLIKEEIRLLKINENEIKVFDRCGFGSSANVRRGTWERQKDKHVALKYVNDLKQLNTEASLLSELNHRNVITLYGIIEPLNCLVLEFAEGGSLYEYLEKQRKLSESLEYSHIIRWASDVAHGLNYLHQEARRTFIHRDIKSKNILVINNVLKLCDFGITREKIVTKSMTTLGTYAWMAPEAIIGENVSEKSDCWSYGVVLWELLTCQIPFDGMLAIQICFFVGNQIGKVEVPTNCPSRFQRIIDGCLEWNPAERFSMRKVLHLLGLMVGDDKLKEETMIFLSDQQALIEDIRKTCKEKYITQLPSSFDNANGIVSSSNGLATQKKLQKESAGSIEDMSIDDVVLWIEKLKDFLDKPVEIDYGQIFREHHINGMKLLNLTTNDLIGMGINSFGHRTTFLQYIKDLQRFVYLYSNFPEYQMKHSNSFTIKPTNKNDMHMLNVELIVNIVTCENGKRWKAQLLHYATSVNEEHTASEDDINNSFIRCIQEVKFIIYKKTVISKETSVIVPPFLMSQWQIDDNKETSLALCISLRPTRIPSKQLIRIPSFVLQRSDRSNDNKKHPKNFCEKYANQNSTMQPKKLVCQQVSKTIRVQITKTEKSETNSLAASLRDSTLNSIKSPSISNIGDPSIRSYRDVLVTARPNSSSEDIPNLIRSKTENTSHNDVRSFPNISETSNGTYNHNYPNTSNHIKSPIINPNVRRPKRSNYRRYNQTDSKQKFSGVNGNYLTNDSIAPIITTSSETQSKAKFPLMDINLWLIGIYTICVCIKIRLSEAFSIERQRLKNDQDCTKMRKHNNDINAHCGVSKFISFHYQNPEKFRIIGSVSYPSTFNKPLERLCMLNKNHGISRITALYDQLTLLLLCKKEEYSTMCIFFKKRTADLQIHKSTLPEDLTIPFIRCKMNGSYIQIPTLLVSNIS
ncbi:hypothetical protein SNEBB_006134 [Seison nebaliae]|nr:hypothetical protein SNEBB_006134 [Seison nebaliae]